MKYRVVSVLKDNRPRFLIISDIEEIEILPSKYLKHLDQINASPNTVKSAAFALSYYYNYLQEQTIGINDKSLFKTIRKQLLILFCVPAISAILCSFVMMSSLNNVYQQILGDKHLYLMYFGLNLIIFFLIYSIYWISILISRKIN